MLLSLPKFEYVSCNTIEEACALLSSHQGKAQVMAGGTDLLVKMKHRKVLPDCLINIKRIPQIDYIRYDALKEVRIGTLATIQTLRNSPVIMKNFSILNQAAKVLGTTHVRNLATLGGNLCNASPASECAGPLLALSATVKIMGPQGERRVPVEEFFVQPGKSVLKHDEILTEIQIPKPPPHSGGVHLKYSTRRVDVCIVSASVLLTLDGPKCQDVRISLGAVGPIPFRAKKAENILKGQPLVGDAESVIAKAAQAASDESFPIDDFRGAADFRKELVKRLVAEGIQGAIANARL
ncbi:MAG: xanthine dehydrogenase family protein subunit M [Desulfobacterales bacterium]|nr:xanthine dehydrogenase family protein subunit M [Desulfobacterales bacterium]